jgi:hypothetical protein
MVKWGIGLLLAAILSLALVSSAPAQPLYCQPDVIKAMKLIWAQSANGTTGQEGAFELDRDGDSYEIIVERPTQEIGYQTINTRPGQTFAVFHVHPNMSLPTPSTPGNNFLGNTFGDTGSADRGQFDIYVVSSRGLTVYFWQTKKIVWLRYGLDWTSAKNCH